MLLTLVLRRTRNIPTFSQSVVQALKLPLKYLRELFFTCVAEQPLLTSPNIYFTTISIDIIFHIAGNADEQVRIQTSLTTTEA